MTITPPDGLTRALQLAAEGSSRLEYTAAPTVQDKKAAQGLFKRATKIMESIVSLEEEGIYQTGPVPMDPDEARYNDPAQHRIELPEVASTIIADEAPALRPYPEVLAQFDTRENEDAALEYDRRLDAMAAFGDGEANYDPWDAAWDADRKTAFTSLLLAEERDPKTFAYPTDEELAAWLAQFAPIEDGQAGDPEDGALDSQQALFDQKLTELEEAGVSESGLKLKGWKKAEKFWRSAFTSDPTGTIDKLLWSLTQALPVWEVPTDEQVAA